MKYEYEKIDRSKGYAWNMLQRIANEIGIEPMGSGDVGEETYLEFDRELTDEEKQKVDAIMSDNPTTPPAKDGTKFLIKDIWNQKKEIEKEMGITYEIYYSESVEGSGNVDQVELHFSRQLTDEEKEKVMSVYANLITVK